MAKNWGTPPFITQNFFFQNDSEWLEMDFKHNLTFDICHNFFFFFEGVPYSHYVSSEMNSNSSIRLTLFLLAFSI